ncbi:MAG: hypothetical protein J5J04_07780 [Anaerolineae bacterium]|jgi:hypothetical protein|nr:MAG: hypothetical protein UZ13_02152 [Chloroflexi bacterium OLB13]MBV6436302.1 hypothetical protein [Anaerolineae bacterium]MCO6443966.1 hypothetical protein [Anaerolineae bacterium]MDL1914825.1 hypothetical protein [Anaerolineae bacterium CFX4]GIK28857.1 MAG: hypothetical protein BroJett007_19950 [Chloroflexota bacterium]
MRGYGSFWVSSIVLKGLAVMVALGVVISAGFDVPLRPTGFDPRFVTVYFLQAPVEVDRTLFVAVSLIWRLMVGLSFAALLWAAGLGVGALGEIHIYSGDVYSYFQRKVRREVERREQLERYRPEPQFSNNPPPPERLRKFRNRRPADSRSNAVELFRDREPLSARVRRDPSGSDLAPEPQNAEHRPRPKQQRPLTPRAFGAVKDYRMHKRSERRTNEDEL